jgi:hypothetical protein
LRREGQRGCRREHGGGRGNRQRLLAVLACQQRRRCNGTSIVRSPVDRWFALRSRCAPPEHRCAKKRHGYDTQRRQRRTPDGGFHFKANREHRMLSTCRAAGFERETEGPAGAPCCSSASGEPKRGELTTDIGLFAQFQRPEALRTGVDALRQVAPPRPTREKALRIGNVRSAGSNGSARRRNPGRGQRVCRMLHRVPRLFRLV